MVPISKDNAKKRGPHRGRGSIIHNRVGNWQVRYTDPYGKHRAGGTFRLKVDADQQLAKILASIENITWREIDNTVSGDLNPKTITLRQASVRYREGRPNKNGQARQGHNVILTPHLGGCTREAFEVTQLAIANHLSNAVLQGI